MSRPPPRSRACTGPTVVASSPVPSQALEITPVRTQRFNWMSCSRARSSAAYSSSLPSAPSVEAIAARSGVPSIVARYARTRAGSGFQSMYSGGSKAGKRFTGSPHFSFSLSLANSPPSYPNVRASANSSAVL